MQQLNFTQLFFIIAIRRPFMITFHTNDNEVVASTSPTGVNSEETMTPQGIIGFSLDYKQISCFKKC